MLPIEQLRESLLRDGLRTALLDRQIAEQVALDAFEFRFGQPRMLCDIGDEPHRLGGPLRQHFGGDRRRIRSHRDAKLTTHRRESLRDHIRGLGHRALAHQVAGEIGEPDLILSLVDVSCRDHQSNRHLRHLAERHHRDGKTVGQRDAASRRQDEVLWSAGARRLLLGGLRRERQNDERRDDECLHRASFSPGAPVFPGEMT